MNYGEIDGSAYGTDIFTKGAEGRYAKPTLPSASGISEDSPKTHEKKKRRSKAASSAPDNSTEQSHEIGNTDETGKVKKKSHKRHENDEIQNQNETSQVNLSVDNDTAVKPKKKRAPRVEPNNENIDTMPDEVATTATEEKSAKKKKSKAPKTTPIEEGSQMIDNSSVNELEQLSTEKVPKVKKQKKKKTHKTSTGPAADTFDDSNEYPLNPDDGICDSEAGAILYDAPPPYEDEPQLSEYESAILDAYENFSSKINFVEYVGDDQWCINHLPKSGRSEPKSRIRKILPGGKDNKSNGKTTAHHTNRFFDRIRSGVQVLVHDESNLIFGDAPNYELLYYDDEESNLDTDDLHRYAQKLRELEDNDREINPEFLVLRDGKTVYGVHETDDEGKTKLSTRKPIYDRFSDQAVDNGDSTDKKNFLSRLRLPFARNKDKDGKGGESPKSSTGTPDSQRKRTKKSNKKTANDAVAIASDNGSFID